MRHARRVLLGVGLFAVLALVLVSLGADDAPKKPPTLDALDKQAMAVATKAYELAQTACDASDTSKHAKAAEKFANTLIEARYPGFKVDWSKGVLVSKEPAK